MDKRKSKLDRLSTPGNLQPVHPDTADWISTHMKEIFRSFT